MTHIKAYLSSYIDGELDEKLRNRVDAHLRECLACRKELHDMEGVDGLLSRMEEVEPSPEFEASVLKSIREREEAAPGFLDRIWNGFLSPVPVMAGAAALVVVLGVLGLYMSHERYGRLEGREEYEIAESLGILQEYPVLQDLDLYEHLEDFQDMDKG